MSGSSVDGRKQVALQSTRFPAVPLQISGAVGPKERLESWKEVASYLRRDVRTVQLWEKTEGLPIHRHVHKKLGTIFAFRSEIDVWLRASSQQSANYVSNSQVRLTPMQSLPSRTLNRVMIAVLPF